ncbi:aldehyde dehydrogenase family protein [Prescottella subtropica]|uniref:aldehyde dehydrogenase family protein n=1 Tax=Prescottella subtropica TaxID=2545757 RepID=UPI0010F8F8A9|nr:aldehyde dehydrogenase family protein [Prescottella subtropica]
MTTELISVNPATLDEVGRVAVTTAAELDAKVSAAHRAFASWRTDRELRRQLLAACADALSNRSAEIAPLLTREQGKPLSEAGTEVWITAHCLAQAARVDWAEETAGPDLPGRRTTIQHRPLGVVGAIVPWNFPLFLMAAKIGPALVAGNTVLVKPAESVSLVVSKVVEILRSVLPDGVLDVVTGGPEVGQQLVAHRKVRKVSFTGSTSVGRLIMRQAADTVTPVTLELGGNDPAILLDDADIDGAATALARGAFFNGGQMCIAPKRAYVPNAMLDAFCDVFADRMAQLVVGDGLEPATTVGPLHNRAQLEFVTHLLDKAVAGGGTVVRGGSAGTDLPGHFLEPTLVRGVDDTADIVAVEQFGPVFPVVGYDDVSRVLTTIDEQEFGLGASVWGTDVERVTAVADRIDAGTVWINQHNALDVTLPFGGVKASGFGREGGTAGVEDFLHTRVVDAKL